jgi:O-antigen ligase
MKPLSIYPWDLRSWKVAFGQAGISGFAMMALLVAGFAQLPDSSGQPAAHASQATLWLIRGPLVLTSALLISFVPRFSRIGIRDLRFWFLLFTVYFTVSTVWSYSPVTTLGKGFELAAGLLIVMQASRDEKAEERLTGLFRLILLLVSAMATVTVVGFLFGMHSFVSPQPNLFMSTSAEAPFLSGNGVGYSASLLILVSFTEWQFSKVRGAGLKWQVVFASILFLFAASRSSFAIILLGLLIVLLRKSKTALVTVTCFLGLGGYLFGKALVKALSFRQSESTLQTLSGRTVMWAAGFRQWTHSPLIGYGGGAGGKYVLSKIGISSVEVLSSMHSGLMETLDGLGTIGFVLGVGILIVATFMAYREWRASTQYIAIWVIVIHFWIASTMSVGVLGWMNAELALYLVFLTLLDVQRRKRVRARVRYGVMSSPVPQFAWSRTSIGRLR